jgi:hypothetical protein
MAAAAAVSVCKCSALSVMVITMFVTMSLWCLMVGEGPYTAAPAKQVEHKLAVWGIWEASLVVGFRQQTTIQHRWLLIIMS